jgi:hypothetical protein
MPLSVWVLVKGKETAPSLDGGPLDCRSLFSKTSVNAYKFASVNFETEKMENYHDGK